MQLLQRSLEDTFLFQFTKFVHENAMEILLNLEKSNRPTVYKLVCPVSVIYPHTLMDKNCEGT